MRPPPRWVILGRGTVEVVAVSVDLLFEVVLDRLIHSLTRKLAFLATGSFMDADRPVAARRLPDSPPLGEEFDLTENIMASAAAPGIPGLAWRCLVGEFNS